MDHEFILSVCELSREFLRDILDLVEYVKAGPADPKRVACKAEEFIEVVFALSYQNVIYFNQHLYPNSVISSTPG